MTCVIKARITDIVLKNKLNKRSKTSEEVCETTAIEGHNPSNTNVIVGDSIINSVCWKRLSERNGVFKVRSFPGATIEDM